MSKQSIRIKKPVWLLKRVSNMLYRYKTSLPRLRASM